jgi:small-conductance mechanosensitive channel
MTRESRLLYLTGLTLFLFAGWGYLSNGSFIFPFPLNPFIFLIVVFQFTWWHYKRGLPIFLFLFTALTGVLSQPFFWEVVLSLDSLQNFAKIPVMVWFEFFSAVGLVASAIYLLNRQKSHFTSLITTAGILLYAFGFLYNYTASSVINVSFELAGFGLIALSVLIRPTYQPFHLLWILLFILEISEWLSWALV